LVSRPVKCQHSLQLCLKLTVGAQLTGDVTRREGDFRILLNFENAVLHPVVACANAAVAAISVDSDGAGGFAGGRIGLDDSMLKLEGSVGSMERAGQAKLDGCFGRIELQRSGAQIRRRSR